MIQYGFFKILVLTLLFALAGFIDSIAGGGGLVSLTSLYAAGLPAVNAVSTNKFSMTFGTLFATFNYAKEKRLCGDLSFPAFSLLLSAHRLEPSWLCVMQILCSDICFL